MTINARRRSYKFATGDDIIKYEAFLKKNLLSLSPRYYGISNVEQIITDDGPMIRLDLTNIIDDPRLDIIAECNINNQYIYLWRDSAWTLAIGAYSEDLRHFSTKTTLPEFFTDYSKDVVKIIIHPLGISPSWFQDKESHDRIC